MPSTRVLLVEDEVFLRLIGADALADAGYEVVEAGNADEALRILQDHDHIDVLFTDVRMPGSMDGLQLVQLVRERWPDIRILVTSGDTWPKGSELPGDGRFLSKPYDLSVLKEQVDQLSSPPS